LASPNIDFSDLQLEEEPTSTEEVIDGEINTDTDAIEEATDEQSPITDGQMPIGESSIDEEIDDSEETPVIGQIIEEMPVIEEVPAIEEQPVVVLDNDSQEQALSTEDNIDSGDGIDENSEPEIN